MMRILSPLSGSVYVAVAGETPVAVCRAESDAEFLTVNGIPAVKKDGVFTAEIPVEQEYLALKFETDAETEEIHVWRTDIPYPIYRLSLDDNVRFLQDIAEKGYESIFENPYMAMYKRLHDKYGTKIHMNIYWESPEYGDFTLAAFPDRYREEWASIRDWFHLSFHAKADKPDQPYLTAGYQKVYDDCKLVMDQIRRFAGDVGYVTTLHWAEATKDGIRGLYDCGVRLLLGDFTEDDQGNPIICYSATKEQFEAVRTRCFWRDPETKMIFFPCDVILNSGKITDIAPTMDRIDARWPNRPFVDILIHEQYFYPDYCIYLPDYEQRIEAGIRWCVEHGYKPGLAEEIIKKNHPLIAGTL